MLLILSAQGLAARPASSGSVPFALDGNRVFAQVEFIPWMGRPRKAMVFVDMGSSSVILSKGLFEELKIGSKQALELRIENMHVPVRSENIASDDWFPFYIDKGRKVEGLLPAGVLQNYQVRFDYAARTMTLAQPSTLALRGTPVPFWLDANTGLIAVEATIDGRRYPITIDNGSRYTWIRQAAAQPWLARHPDWQRGTGAVGPSNMRMADDGIEAAGTLLRMPDIGLGSVKLQNVGALAVARDNQGNDLMDWYSQKNAVAVIGWLGGNVLRHYRITVDYPNKMSYWEPQSATDAEDLNYIGLTLLSKRGDYYVAGVAIRDDRPTVKGVQVGDKLVRIGDLPTHGASRAALLGAMRGNAGETRWLELDRAGSRVQVQATVTAF